jgi:hypothetical protein
MDIETNIFSFQTSIELYVIQYLTIYIYYIYSKEVFFLLVLRVNRHKYL